MSTNLTTQGLADRVGITYRQISHWVKAGYVEPIGGPRGSGHYWRFSEQEARVVTLMADLVGAGVKPMEAELMARELATDGVTSRGAVVITVAQGAVA